MDCCQPGCEVIALSLSFPPLAWATETKTNQIVLPVSEMHCQLQPEPNLLLLLHPCGKVRSDQDIPSCRCQWQAEEQSTWTPAALWPPVRKSTTARSHCCVGSASLMSRSVRSRHSFSRASPEQTVPVFSQLVRGIMAIPGALCLVLLNRLLYVLYAMLHRWHFGQREGPAAKAAPSCCSFHLS